MDKPNKRFMYLIFVLSIFLAVSSHSDADSQAIKNSPLWSKIDLLSSEVEGRCIRRIGTQGTLMKIITLHSLVNVGEGFYASASEIRRTWDTSPCNGTGNGRLSDIP